MHCKVCGTELRQDEERCGRCHTAVLKRDAAKPDLRLKEYTPRPEKTPAGAAAPPQPVPQPPPPQARQATPDAPQMSSQLQPTVGKLLNRPGKDEEVLDAYYRHILKKLSNFPENDARAERCRTVFHRMQEHRKAGDTSKALRFATTCILMLEEIAPTQAKTTDKGISPELKRAANAIDKLQRRALEAGVNILGSERLRTTAVDAFKIGAVEQGSHILYKCLETLCEEVREYALQRIQVYQAEGERGKALKIDTGTLDALIIEARLRLGERDYISALNFMDELKASSIELREELGRKTNTFDCPVCGMVNSVEADECQICGTIFPELGPLYKGEKVRVAPPGRKLK